MIDCSAINVTTQENVCAWIASKGGTTNIAVFDIMTLVSAYLGHANIGFTVTISHIMGGVAYYLNNVSSGNSLTGCSLTIDIVCPQSVEADISGNITIPILVSAPLTNASTVTKTIRLTIGSRNPIIRDITMAPGEIRTETFTDTGITSQTSFLTEVI